MSTERTTSPPPIGKGQRSKRLDALCDKYIKNLLELTSIDNLRKHLDEQKAMNDTELEYASKQMTDYAQIQLRESLTTLFDEEHIKERLDTIEECINHKEEDYESAYTNSIRQPYGDKFRRFIPKPMQLSKAELYKLKRKELERLQAQRDSLRQENKASMEALIEKKLAAGDLAKNPLPALNTLEFDERL